MDTIKKFFENIKNKINNASVVQLMRVAASVLTIVGCGAIAVASFNKENNEIIDISNEAEVVDTVLDEVTEPVE